MRRRSSWTGSVAPLTVTAVLLLAVWPLRAGMAADGASSVGGRETGDQLPASEADLYPAQAAVRALIDKETATSKLPADIAEAVVFVESRYESDVTGRAGEIGLMQIKLETAAGFGFKGTAAELATPEINIHYGVAHLAKAWTLAKGDLCRALMTYRAGDDEDGVAPRSAIYCNRVRNRLTAMNSAFAAPTKGTVTSVATKAVTTAPSRPVRSQASKPTDVYAVYKRGTAAASRAYWAAHESRIRAIKARVEAKRRRVASR
ncbi:murein transglycosylase [Bradyrhizobium guangdongense]|uniref:transglycosylase SLT domain-containing protein n=1 Tax=Bradyrhizobium guangdongense TaxID=1325090 RepID=UPI0011276E2B|nr:transglycosylase SLT domain-containing protein [Bradyrhizobium guangdongense]TPQ32975.1 murein transglycosylase [Bradyrhizobium guangdongense]